MIDDISKNKNCDWFQSIRLGELEFIKKSIRKLDINMVNEFGQSLLHEAIAYKQKEIAIELLKESIDVNIQDKEGRTALHYIGFHPDIDIARIILDNGGDVKLKDLYGNIPLWYAVFNARGRYELVELFLKYKSNVNIKNNAGRTSLDFALQKNDEVLVNILRNNCDDSN
ncbi:ankyrin repeat domain-containing protein [Wukongibacter baidiensis]|uniref:ankyrin repeat domain-containing protein n=1 Tax=Wukongibacter baidiensis TaxID=1723361 RepID=UPI003D7F320D